MCVCVCVYIFPSRAKGAIIGVRGAGRKELDEFLAPDTATLSTLSDPALLEFTTSEIKAEAAVKMLSKALRRVSDEDPIVNVYPVLPGDESAAAEAPEGLMRPVLTKTLISHL